MEGNYELRDKLARLQWLMQKKHLRGRAHRGPMADTSRGQGRILAMLRMKEDISTRDLSYLLGIRVSSLNELLAKLEKGGYILRRPSEEDRRVMLIALTEKGREAEEGAQEDLFSCLSQQEQDTLGEYLDRMIAMLEQKLGVDEGEDDWIEGAKERFGPEGFAHMMHMRGGFRGKPGAGGGRKCECQHERRQERCHDGRGREGARPGEGERGARGR